MYADHKTIGGRLDAIAKGSGFYAVTMIERPRPRNLRFVPVMILAATLIGYVLTCVSSVDMPPMLISARISYGVAGALLFWSGSLAANFVRFLGPRIFPDPAAPLDERERILRARAGSISGGIVTALAMAGCFYCGFAQVFGWWMPRKLVEWTYLALLIQAGGFTLPVLIASWLQPADTPDED